MTSIRVLLIDDDASSVRGLARYLRLGGEFEVTIYDNGTEALAHLAAQWQTYTAVLLDFVLAPPVSGERVLAEIRERYPRLPVIVFTGRDPTGGVQALEKGAYRYMRRPIDQVEMINLIRHLAEQDLIFYEMVQDVRRILDSDLCLAWRLDKRTQRFRIVAWDGELDETYRRQVSLDLEAPTFFEFLRKGEIGYVPDVTDPRQAPWYTHRDEAKAQGWTSLISIPLVYQNRFIGLIDSYTYAPFAFADEAHRRLVMAALTAFAKQAAEAVRNAALSNQLEALHGINQILAGTFDEETVIRQILSKGLELVGTDIGWLYLVDHATGQLVLKEHVGLAEALAEATRALGVGVTGWVAEQGQALNVPDVTREKRYLPLPGHDIKSEVAVPLRREEETIGVLTAKSRFPAAFTDDDVNLLMSLATQAAIVIGRAQLTKHLQAVSRLALTGNYQEVAQYVVEAVRDLTGAAVNLWGISDKGEVSEPGLAIVATRGNFDPLYLRQARLPLAPEKSITAQALAQGRPILRADVLDDPAAPRFYHFEEARQQGWHSFMAAPLIGRDGQRLGSLNLYSREIAKFGRPEDELMRTFANQAAIAIENARLFDDTQRRIRDLEIINEVGVIMSTKLRTRNLLQTIVSQIAQQFNCPHCTFFFPQKEEGTLYLVPQVTHGLSSAQLRQRRFKPGEGLAGWVFQHGQSVVLNDARDDPRFAPATTGPDRPRSMLVAPVKVGDQTIGVISTDQDKFGWFSENDRRLVDTLARQAGIAIQRASALELLQDIANRIISPHKKVDEILLQIVSGAIELTNTTAGVIHLLSEDGQSVLKSFQFPPDFDDLKPHLERGGGLTHLVTPSGKMQMIADIRQDKRVEAALGDRFQSLIAIPLDSDQKIIGVLLLCDVEWHDFTETDVSLLSTLANQAAIAIENARLYSDMEQLVEERTREWQAAQARAAAAEKLAVIGQLGAEFAHRMANLAGTIPVRVDLIKHGLDPANTKDARVIRQVDKIARDAVDLMQAARIIRDPENQKSASVDVNQLIEMALDRVWTYQLDAGDRIEVRKEFAAELPTINIRQDRLLDTLISLIQNGVEAISGEGTLTISTRTCLIRNRPAVEIVIADTGIGIPEDQLPHIFDIFLTTKEHGLGFGLWLDQTFIQGLGGEFDVQSEVGVGSTFTVRIPMSLEA